MKKQIRLLGIDDSPFTFSDKYATVIGVIMRGGGYIDCILRNKVVVDGNDSTNTCIEMIVNTRFRKQLRAIMLDGVALGGFNVIDIDEVYSSTNLPIITVTRDMPDYTKIEKALKENFNDWKNRLSLLKVGVLHKIETSHNPIFIKYVGLSLDEAKEIIKLSTIRGVIPEPIRLAHLIASGIKRGESYGKA